MVVVMWFAAIVRTKAGLDQSCEPFQHATTLAGSILYGFCYLPILLAFAILLWGNATVRERTQASLGCCVLSFVLMVACAEINMKTWVFLEDNGSIVPMTASNWGVGQVMAVVMVGAQIWEIILIHVGG